MLCTRTASKACALLCSTHVLVPRTCLPRCHAQCSLGFNQPAYYPSHPQHRLPCLAGPGSALRWHQWARQPVCCLTASDALCMVTPCQSCWRRPPPGLQSNPCCTLSTNALRPLPVQVRDWIAPVNRRWPLKELLGSLRRHFPRGSTRGPHGRHVLIEYVMLRGVNDSLEDAHR